MKLLIFTSPLSVSTDKGEMLITYLSKQMSAKHESYTVKYNTAMKLASRYLMYGVITGFLVVVWLFTRSDPQKSPKKVIENKKAYVSRSNNCFDTYTKHLTAENTVKLPIILYHYVENVEDRKDLNRIRMSVTPMDFERQVAQLVESGYSFIFVKEVNDLMKNPSNWCYPAVALTFDDGYEDFYNDVFPILKKYKVKATVYLIVNYIGRKDFLNESQIRELLESGLVEIGSHTMDHSDLTEIDAKSVADQVIISRRILEAIYDVTVESFAYPLGKYNEEVVIQARIAGYTSAVTVKKGDEHAAKSLFELRRMRPENFFNHQITE